MRVSVLKSGAFVKLGAMVPPFFGKNLMDFDTIDELDPIPKKVWIKKRIMKYSTRALQRYGKNDVKGIHNRLAEVIHPKSYLSIMSLPY